MESGGVWKPAPDAGGTGTKTCAAAKRVRRTQLRSSLRDRRHEAAVVTRDGERRQVVRDARGGAKSVRPHARLVLDRNSEKHAGDGGKTDLGTPSPHFPRPVSQVRDTRH